ncbi:helix-turn-helix transcriptional regulator [Cohnella faecalis]|uniref:YafY family transcriptional regulator n=1 Tax=Cohnella faecalis TaxID=2315694 RepID=A0A398CQ00_9BACL|nr:YafY family protein [Cohnella faecalis]RIE01907.1 YafY family transcriptional regulator [Cohnella faecalis]
MRAGRLLVILASLQRYGRRTAKELAEELEVSERTIHRDMEALSASGIPIYAVRGAQGGWVMQEGYRSRLTGLTTEEIRSLLMLQSSSVVKDLGLGGDMRNAFNKLLSALPDAARTDAEFVRERIHVDGAGWHSADPEENRHLAVVQEAAWTERKLRFTYRQPGSSEDKERTACPLGLVAKQSVWYMIAAAEEGDEPRTYRISRIRTAELSDQSFERPKDFALADYWERSTLLFKASLPRYPATVKIAAGAAERFRRERYVRVAEESPAEDGSIEAKAEFHTMESALEIVLAYGRRIRVIAPAALAEAVAAEACAIAALYEDA